VPPRDGSATARRWNCIAAGKASAAMMVAARDVLGERLGRSLLVAADRSRLFAELSSDPRIDAIVGGHPVPDDNSERAGRRALDVASQSTTADTLLVLLSGGADSTCLMHVLTALHDGEVRVLSIDHGLRTAAAAEADAAAAISTP
jgi:glycerate-2-kinase